MILASTAAADVQYDVKGFNIHTGEELLVSTYPVPGLNSRSFQAASSAKTSAQADVSYSTNWCGAVQNPKSGTFTQVIGVWNVVDLSKRSGQSSDTQTLCQWVGIDGTGPCNGLLQTGQFTTVSTAGS